MSQGIGVVGLYVHDQEEALQFYVEKLGFRVHTDVKNGDYRWPTVQHPEQPSLQLGLFRPQAPVLDEATAQSARELVAKGAMPPLVLTVDDCRGAYDRMLAGEWSSRRSRSTASAASTRAFATRRATAGR